MTQDQAANAPGPTDRTELFRLVFGQMAAHTLRAATKLGLVDLLGDGEAAAEDLAGDLGTHPQATYRLLRALAGLGLLAERRPGVFAATPKGLLLSGKQPGSMASLVSMFTDPAMLRGWEHLADSVRTGTTSFDTVFGTDFFSHLRRNPELSAEFNAAMSQATHAVAAALPGAYDFGRFAAAVDVGGGDGTLLAAVLRAVPALRGVVYDTEEGLAQAADTFDAAGVADRAATVAGDFFTSVPPGGDLYLLKSVIHDWNDEDCTGILRRCREALPPHGRVLIVEPVLPPTVDPDRIALTYLSDLNMLVNVGGRERTAADFAALCRAAGLTEPVVTPLPAPLAFCLIEAAPAA
ncbi:methyltransferase [Streptomyces sp. B1866]|uniref:methyltransferase n=1 Tax=Streptomyces sp. B1866 TaxID=3075431 RepID=UPI0028922299|nr:methyltransferase [Streptomyces sp. B1866]MDT3399402.1 methyltransferase [Streptomyces sp. B1866]